MSCTEGHANTRSAELRRACKATPSLVFSPPTRLRGASCKALSWPAHCSRLPRRRIESTSLIGMASDLRQSDPSSSQPTSQESENAVNYSNYVNMQYSNTATAVNTHRSEPVDAITSAPKGKAASKKAPSVTPTTASNAASRTRVPAGKAKFKEWSGNNLNFFVSCGKRNNDDGFGRSPACSIG